MGAELVGRGEPEIHLETGWQQKRPVDRGRDLELEVVQGSKFAVEVVGPIGEDRIQRDIFGDAEVQVDVGPSILSAVRRRAGHRSSGDAGVLLGEPEQLPSQRITMIAGEHTAESSCPVIVVASGPEPGRPVHRNQRMTSWWIAHRAAAARVETPILE